MTAAPICSIQTDLENTLNRTWQDVEIWANANYRRTNAKAKTLLITVKRLAKKNLKGRYAVIRCYK